MKPNLIDAIVSLVPGAEVSVVGEKDIIWYKPSSSPVTNQQIQDELNRLVALAPLVDCKNAAKEKIALTDWSALPDVGLVNQADFIAYRAALRALIINPVANPVWPAEPTPEWG